MEVITADEAIALLPEGKQEFEVTAVDAITKEQSSDIIPREGIISLMKHGIDIRRNENTIIIDTKNTLFHIDISKVPDNILDFASWSKKDTLSIDDVPNPCIAIHQEGELLVSIKLDGTFQTGPTYEPNQAARIFWSIVAKHVPCHTCFFKAFYEDVQNDNNGK